jgi:hypothetical protein
LDLGFAQGFMPLLGVEQGFHRKKLSIENVLGMKFAAQSDL